mgnify:CR=1 FL=1
MMKMMSGIEDAVEKRGHAERKGTRRKGAAQTDNGVNKMCEGE